MAALKSNINPSITNISFFNGSFEKAIGLVQSGLEERVSRIYYYLNAHAINLAAKDKEFHAILRNNAFNFPDGMGLKIAGRFEGYRLQENLNGTDMYPKLMDLAKDNDYSVFFLGAKENVLDNLCLNARKNWETVRIAGRHHGYFDKKEESPSVIEKINFAKPDILFVSFGMPLQEKWIAKYAPSIEAKAIFATGGLFDFYGGKVKRAPIWMRKLGLEWLYRMFIEPKRLWKRYVLGNPVFLMRLIKNRIIQKDG